MSAEPQTEQEGEILRLFREADDSTKCVIMLMGHSLKRKDEALWKGLAAIGHMKRPDTQEDNIGEPDFVLVGRLRSICSKEESLWWGRALVHAYLEGDRPRKDALLELIQRRLAS